jgi:signal transduction histidine kinase
MLLVDLLRGRWADAVVTGLVVDLGAPDEVGTLRGKLARALGDPSLEVGYRLPETGRFVDDAGRPVELPPPGSGRTATPIDDRGEQVAVLVHDAAVLAEKRLLESVAAAAQIAVANARLQAEARARTAELEASRRRIVEAGDAQRRRLEQELRRGADRRLRRVAALLADARSTAPGESHEAVAALEAELGEAQRELEEFAHGVHPAALTDGGLAPALRRIAQRSRIPVRVTGQVGTLPGAIEAALFFVCSEALANVAKHSEASHVAIELEDERGEVIVSVADDGVGGANPGLGSGLRGLADRVEALGGSLSVRSPAGEGTRVTARIPLAG